MAYVYESLDSFLNEDMGNLNIFKDIPDEWHQWILGSNGGYNAGGRNSEVSKIENPTDSKILAKSLRADGVHSAIIKINGKSKYFIRQESPQKFKVYDADQMYSVEKKRREEERKKREKNESISFNKLDEIRRGRHNYQESGLIDSKNINEIVAWIQKLQSEGKNLEFFVIGMDKDRAEKSRQRREEKNISDPYEKKPSYGVSDKGSSDIQINRYNIYAEKKRAELDKLVDDEIEKFKNQIISNMDKAIEDIMENLRKGYAWYADSKNISEKIMKGVDLSGIKRFAEAYDAIEPSGDKDPLEASKKLKKLGFN
jgi:hypothetical protein